MKLEYVPLLQTQRKLQGMPRGAERFMQYLRTIISEDGTSLDLPPLGVMNPMGREHVTELLDALLALDADRIAAETLSELAEQFADEPGEFKAGLVIADDLKGGWTNRFDYEFNLRFGGVFAKLEGRKRKWLHDWWLTAILWSSEPASKRVVRESIRTMVMRVVHVQRHGSAQTLRDMLAQEGAVMAAAGCTGPVLDDDDIAFTREVLSPYLEASDKRTVIECLFGDAAGRTLGFTPRGLSPWAGMALALHDARPITSRKPVAAR